MNTTIEWISLQSELKRFQSDLWHFYISVPASEVKPLLQNNRRVLCRINDVFTFQCALMPDGNGDYFININKDTYKKYINISFRSPRRTWLCRTLEAWDVHINGTSGPILWPSTLGGDPDTGVPTPAETLLNESCEVSGDSAQIRGHSPKRICSGASVRVSSSTEHPLLRAAQRGCHEDWTRLTRADSAHEVAGHCAPGLRSPLSNTHHNPQPPEPPNLRSGNLQEVWPDIRRYFGRYVPHRRRLRQSTWCLGC